MFYKFKTKPYQHQLDTLKESWEEENFAYFMEMGTGKSKVLIDNASMLYDKGLINGLLLIGNIFLLGIPLLPPLAVITDTIFIIILYYRKTSKNKWKAKNKKENI